MNTTTITVSRIEETIRISKEKLRKLFSSTDSIIKELGAAFESEIADPSMICTRIKQALKEEIDEELITERQIERCCLDKWKKRTKPKGRRNDKMSFKPSLQDIQGSSREPSALGDTESSTGHLLPESVKGGRHAVSTYYTVPKEKFAELMTALRNSKDRCLLTFDSNRYVLNIIVG